MEIKRKKSDAVRTCLGCRRKRKRGEMVRIVRHPGGYALFDVDGRLPGRGAYVCPRGSCLRSLSPSTLAHHLRARVTLPDPNKMKEDLASALNDKVRNLLSISRKAGAVRVGYSSVAEAIEKGCVFLLLLASDLSPRTADRLLRHAPQVPVRRVGDKETIGQWLGRSTAGSAAVTDSGLARRMVSLLDRLTSVEDSSYHAEQQ